MAREGRGEGTVGRRPRWFAVAAAAIVPAPWVSVGGRAPGRGLRRRSRAPGLLEPPLRVPGRPLPSSPPAARSRAGPGPCVVRGSASRRSSEAAAGGKTERQPGVYPGRTVHMAGVLDFAGAGSFSLVRTTRMGRSGPRPVWPSRACRSLASSAGRLVGRPHSHVLPPACEGSGSGQAPPGPLRSQQWVRAPACRSPSLGPSPGSRP